MKYLVDADFLFGLFVPDDAHHVTSKRILKKYRNSIQLFVIDLVLFEVATVISYKVNQTEAVRFLDLLPKLELTKIEVRTDLEEKAWNVFRKQTKKGTSFVHCANLAMIELYKLDGILSFDTFYTTKLRF